MKTDTKTQRVAIAEMAAKTSGKHSLLRQYKKHYELVLMLLPGLLALFLFNYLPMTGILIAFKDYKMLKGILGSEWVGLKYFQQMFSGSDFFLILKNTLVISFLKLLFGFPGPIILALMLNEMRSKTYKKVVQTLTYLPHFFSWVVLGGIFIMVFSVTGPFNVVLQKLGVQEPLVFFGDAGLFRTMIVGTAVWQGLGWGAIVYIAALSGIDESLYEAAYMDGASRWKQVLHISIPCLLPTISTVLLLNLAQVLNAGFDQIYNMYNPTVYEVADILDTYVLRKLRDAKYGIGTAAGLFKSAVSLLFVLGANWLTKKLSHDELGIL